MTKKMNDKNFLSSKDFIHENSVITNAGVSFNVKYCGCIEVFASMKVLDFQTRSMVAKECIHRVCDAINSKSSKKRHIVKRVKQCISSKTCLEFAGCDVILNISSRCLEIKTLDTKEVVARHEMPRISFASGGDSDTKDFIAYVAKDVTDWRACYVINCGAEQAQNLISTLGQAFELRYKEYYGADLDKPINISSSLNRKQSATSCDQEYYNDLPGKVPPDLTKTSLSRVPSKSPKAERPRERISSNLIDLDTPMEEHHEYVNEGSKVDADLFDDLFSSSSSPEKKPLLQNEKWFHGPITRTFSESLLKNDGDFLVRESQNTRGQFVLTGMKSGHFHHLLLIDKDGCIRTKDRQFDSISHLINYHWSNFLPIISSESALLLQTPVLRTAEIKK